MDIPIAFEHEGKLYKGVFSAVSGGGCSHLFHLYINKRYYGQLSYVNEWRWSSNKDYFKGMDEFFGMWIIMWHDCNCELL